MPLIDNEEASAILAAVADGKGCLAFEYIVEGAIDLYFSTWNLVSRGRGWTAEDRYELAQVILNQFFVLVQQNIFKQSDNLGYKGDYYYYNAGTVLPTEVGSIAERCDFAKPQRVQMLISRIIRDPEMVAQLKEIYKYRCCLCQVSLRISEHEWYCEVHHLRPLGEPHNGPDTLSNMMVLCPNHHALFDHGIPVWEPDGSINVCDEVFNPVFRHEIDERHIEYYKSLIQVIV